jgi:phosphopantetheine adenylyltransferase
MVKEVASFGGSVKNLVPEMVEKALRKKFEII